MINNPRKPEFRDPTILGKMTYIHATHWWLYQTCDEYVLADREVWGGDQGDADGVNWKYRFLLWKDARQELCLEFSAYGQDCLWVGFNVDGQSTRAAPIDRINAFELTRRVRDKMVEVYYHMHNHAHPDADGECWILSYIENDDGLGAQRRFVYEKFFVLDRPIGWVDAKTGELMEMDDHDRPSYFFIPKSEIRSDGLFRHVSSPEKDAA